MKVTKRFIDSIENISESDIPKLAFAMKEVSSFASSQGETGPSGRKQIDRLHGKIDKLSKQLSLGPAYEFKPSIRQRMIFATSEEVTFLDYSHAHQAVEGLEEQRRPALRSILTNLAEMPSWLKSEIETQGDYQSELELEFKNLMGGNRQHFDELLTNDWITFLDQQQTKQLELLERNLLASQDEFSLHMILGGAGTGKTMLLIQLAWRLRNEHGLEVELSLPKGVKEQLSYMQSNKWNAQGNSGIYLYDDPLKFENLQKALEKAKTQKRPFVYAIDPTQWEDKRVREKFSGFLAKNSLNEYLLTTAYRQGGVIGDEVRRIATNFLRSSSFRAAESSVKSELSSSEYWELRCLADVESSDKEGFYVEYHCKTSQDYRAALDEIVSRAKSFSTWRVENWPTLLVGTDPSSPSVIGHYLDDLRKSGSLRARSKSFLDVEDIRGAEFENVVIAVSMQQWRELNKGLTALSGPEWQAFLRILTFMSRAENQLAILIRD
jgi:hypothetical protein